jgi:hypothetical protein
MQRAEAAMVHTQRDTHVNNPTFGAATSPAPIISSDVKYILSRRNITCALPARPGQNRGPSGRGSPVRQQALLLLSPSPTPSACTVHVRCDAHTALAGAASSHLAHTIKTFILDISSEI